MSPGVKTIKFLKKSTQSLAYINEERIRIHINLSLFAMAFVANKNVLFMRPKHFPQPIYNFQKNPLTNKYYSEGSCFTILYYLKTIPFHVLVVIRLIIHLHIPTTP